jgi:hypothetical protein
MRPFRSKKRRENTLHVPSETEWGDYKGDLDQKCAHDQYIGRMPDLLPALHYVAQNQASFEASENIYGKFPEMLARIQTLYADTAGSRRKRI